MTDEAKQVIEILNRSPFNKQLNVISFHSLSSDQLLQLLNDVFAAIDSTQAGDIREEASDVRAQRTLMFLKTLKYQPSNKMEVSNFRQGIVLGDKLIIHPILLYLLKNLSSLKTRAYLARFLVTLQVPDDLLLDSSDKDMQDNWVRYKELQDHFSNIHKDLTDLQKQSGGTNEVKTDIKTMEEEKENLMRKVERARKKVEVTPDFSDVLQVAQRMRTEKQNSDDLRNKIQQQTRLKQSAEHRFLQKKQQINSIMKAGPNSSPEMLIARMEEDNRLNKYLVEDKLPKEIEARQKTLRTLQKISMEPITPRDLNQLEERVNDAADRVNKLVEKQVLKSDPTHDKAAVFRQQASILAHKKDTLANALHEKKEEAAALERELVGKRRSLSELGGEVLKGDDYKMYVAKLRTKNIHYKKCRTELSSLRAEHGVLSRTEVILKKIQGHTDRRVSMMENKKGVSGFRETQDELEKVSAMKSELDESKHRTLDDMSETVQQLHTLIHEKKALLAPVIKELRPLRQKRQEIAMNYEEKKAQYEGISAGLESNRAHLEQTVTAMREECANQDSRFFYIQTMCKILQSQKERAEYEMELYKKGEKKDCYREIYTKKIKEQENKAKVLREEKKSVQDNQEGSAFQLEMWTDLERLLQCKEKFIKDRCNEINKNKTNKQNSLDTMVF